MKLEPKDEALFEFGAIGGRGTHPADPTGETFGPTHWPLPQKHELGVPSMKYMVIDTTAVEGTRFIAIAPLKEAQAIGRIEKAAGKTVIAPPVEGRGFSKLELLSLQYLFWNTTQQRPSDDYGTMLGALLDLAKALPVDTRPLSELEAEVRRLYPDEPKAAQTGDKAQQTPRAQREPGEAPKAGSTTGKVWEIADRQLKLLHPSGDLGTVDWKTVRVGIMDACETEGINKATAATQYSKWKASKTNAAAS